MVWEIVEVNQGQLSGIRMEVWIEKSRIDCNSGGTLAEVPTGAAQYQI